MSTTEKKELVFGSDEWMEELRKIKFPKMIAVYYGIHQEEDDKKLLYSRIINTKSIKPNNVKLGSISQTLSMILAHYNWLIEGVYYIESSEEYFKKMKKLCEIWKIDFNDNN